MLENGEKWWNMVGNGGTLSTLVSFYLNLVSLVNLVIPVFLVNLLTTFSFSEDYQKIYYNLLISLFLENRKVKVGIVQVRSWNHASRKDESFGAPQIFQIRLSENSLQFVTFTCLGK